MLGRTQHWYYLETTYKRGICRTMSVRVFKRARLENTITPDAPPAILIMVNTRTPKSAMIQRLTAKGVSWKCTGGASERQQELTQWKKESSECGLGNVLEMWSQHNRERVTTCRRGCRRNSYQRWTWRYSAPWACIQNVNDTVCGRGTQYGSCSSPDSFAMWYT